MSHNLLLLRKLVIIAVGMFAFGYALVPMYKAICELTLPHVHFIETFCGFNAVNGGC